MPSFVPFPLIPGQDPVEFRLNVAQTRALEKAAGVGIQKLLSDSRITDVTVLMVCYGLKHIDPNMNEARAEELVQGYIDNGGDTTELFKALMKALNGSGLYGKPAGESPLGKKKTPKLEPATV